MNWQAILSIRFWLTCGLAAFAIAFIPLLISPIFGQIVFFGVFALLLYGGAKNKSLMLYCPYCRKRVKIGASACHHCGRAVA